jgi:mevalonate kinase
MAVRTIVASAPAKVILLGGKGVNWGFPALVAAVGIRTVCTLRAGGGDGYRFTSGDRTEAGDLASLASFKARVEALRAAKDYAGITAVARSDFFAPTRNVLAHVAERTGVLGFEVEWKSDIPVGSGLGSGAAAAASLAAAAFRAAGVSPDQKGLAWVAWQADVIAHGGLGTGLDTGACTLGGIVRYSLKDGPSRLPADAALPLVVGDTLLRASTATSNTASRNWLDEHPMRFHLLQEMGILVEQAQAAIIAGDLPRLGHLMNLNHLIKEKLGMSVPKTEQLIEAVLGAGALGAKISGKGMGGIIVALAGPGKEQDIARAIEAAGGTAIVPPVGVDGATIESDTER